MSEREHQKENAEAVAAQVLAKIAPPEKVVPSSKKLPSGDSMKVIPPNVVPTSKEPPCEDSSKESSQSRNGKRGAATNKQSARGKADVPNLKPELPEPKQTSSSLREQSAYESKAGTEQLKQEAVLRKASPPKARTAQEPPRQDQQVVNIKPLNPPEKSVVTKVMHSRSLQSCDTSQSVRTLSDRNGIPFYIDWSLPIVLPPDTPESDDSTAYSRSQSL